MTTDKFIKATAAVSVDLNGTTYQIKPLSFKSYLLIQKELRKSFDDAQTTEDREAAYVSAIKMLAEALKLPVEDVMESDMEFINRLIEVFLLQMK
jgi:hypothetical protein